MAETHHFDISKLFSVQGWVCVVTGGGTGIGLMATQALAANGAKVYITGRRTEALENAAKEHNPCFSTGGKIIPVGPCDVRKKEDLERVVEELQTTHGEKYINLLVCNAGVAGPKAEPEEADASELKKKLWENESVEAWQSTFETDVTSVYFTTVAFLPLLQASLQPKGPLERFQPSVITTSSMSGLMRHAQGHFSYNAAKGATVHLSKLMSAEFQQTGIRVNSIAPGYFPSEMTAKSSDNRQKSELPAEKVQEKGHVPAERGGRDEEMGMTVLYLARNSYVNGEIIAVDGGVLNVVSGR
ncbi:short chain dehydrogenase reductase family [Diaporthe eres]|uniref:Short chain dehydrogenase/reductase n=1 Tax=Diaporthe vaccinii TaxID=105482 RepID=A0ABR4EFG8_9PEZI|nr:short chain dehydrogenase reductase family [Diaporthe eres]